MRIAGLLLLVTDGYVAWYGWYEVRIFSGRGDADGSVINAAGIVQTAVSAWLAGLGPWAVAALALAVGATGLSLAILVADLGRPKRFVHMLRVVKPTSPMSIGAWLLSGFTPLVTVAALDEVSGVLPRRWAELVGHLAGPSGLAAVAVAPAVTTYTGTLIADTAVPVWHNAYRASCRTCSARARSPRPAAWSPPLPRPGDRPRPGLPASPVPSPRRRSTGPCTGRPAAGRTADVGAHGRGGAGRHPDGLPPLARVPATAAPRAGDIP
ncbi:NrfD/PsrC family molybdoenzyme membrane anchor subunit [Micromonospora chersina]|uniref:NrfD/PsrC family molybdoenzyme membrane anchor subunit n=1 Tax=Micromonospora chersina TaxID=47854 RepID=UPI0036B589A7